MKNNQETKLQVAEIEWFRNTRQPGVLWSNDNNATSAIETMTKRSKGMLKGCSDLSLLLFNRFIAIENKTHGAVFKTKHLLEQIEFGKSIEKHGGLFFFCFSLDDFKKIVEGDLDNTLTKFWIDKVINCKTVNFKF